MRIELAVCLAIGCGGPAGSAPPAVPAPAASAIAASPASGDVMESFTQNGYLLAGAEYWPYVGADEIKYPEAVLWGFYPEAGVTAPGETTPNVESAQPAALACARTAYDALRTFLASDPPALRRIVELGASQGFVPRFYLWTNDYTRAAAPYPPGVREARLWYWKRKTPDAERPPGYWKWESTLTQAGACQIPRAEQITAYLAEALATVEAAQR